jgi:hypothetical protein
MRWTKETKRAGYSKRSDILWSRSFFIEVRQGCVRINKYHLNLFPVRDSDDAMETVKRYYRIDRSRIAYVRFILEAYEGVANMTTLDSQQGMVRMAIAPGCQSEIDSIVSDLKQKILLEPVDNDSRTDE